MKINACLYLILKKEKEKCLWSLHIRRRRIKSKFSYRWFEQPNILRTSDELLRLNFFLGSITPKTIGMKKLVRSYPWIRQESVESIEIPWKFHGKSMDLWRTTNRSKANPSLIDTFQMPPPKMSVGVDSNGIVMESGRNRDEIPTESGRNLRIHDGIRDPVSPGSLIWINMNT